MEQEMGAPFGTGSRASHEAAGAMLPRATYFSCVVCGGTREAFGSDCQTCRDPDPSVARFVLERLTPEQMAFLRAYGHTLAYQPLTKQEHDAWQCEYWVEADDGEWCEDACVWLIAPTRHWFANGMMHFGPCGEGYFIKYNPLGLLLRSCLMSGADASVPQYTPASAIEARRAETEGLGAEHESAIGEAETPNPTPDNPHA